MSPRDTRRGIIGWMTHNGVTPNLLMIALIVGGIWTAYNIKQEVFPEFELDRVTVSVPYPGASPEEVERGVVLPVEEAIRGLDGIKEITSTAGEGSGSVSIELLEDADQQRVYQEIQQAVDRVRTFPRDAERPEVRRVARRREVLDLLIYGDVDERALRETAEQTRDRLLLDERVTQVDVMGGRNFEIHIELSEEAMRAYNLTLEEVATRIQQSSIELPGGRLETVGGELLVRVTDRRDWAWEFEQIPILQTRGGGVVHLADIASVTEGFEEADRSYTYNGKPCMILEVYRVGEETPIGVSTAVHDIMAEIEVNLPAGIDWAVKSDRSEIYQQRLDLLVKNILLGLALVLIALGLFLELRVAFWVTMGIPTSFLGSIIFLPVADVSINMISMFAFIISLGIVVDDAIVSGENIFEHRQRGLKGTDAAVIGAREVASPIAFSILSNIIAFLPLFFVPGFLGKIWKVIPIVVISVFLISWLESVLILPAHLAHTSTGRARGLARLIQILQRACSGALQWFVDTLYRPVLRLTIRWRILTFACALTILAGTGGYVFGGHIGMILMPRIESDTARASAVLPPGTPASEVEAVRDRLVEGVREVVAENGGEDLVTGVFARVDETSIAVRAYLTPPDVRPISTTELSKLWRKATGPIPGLQSIRFSANRGGPGGRSALTIELSHKNNDTLRRASLALAEYLRAFPNVTDLDDGAAQGKAQINITLNEAGAALGLTSTSVARQIRGSFFGAEALRQQRVRHEIRVLVRRPSDQRDDAGDIEDFLITTPSGRQVPLSEIATIERGRAFTAIQRRDARRTATVAADVDPIGEVRRVMATLGDSVFPQLRKDFPGLTVDYRGRQSSWKESTNALFRGLLLSLIGIFFLLAIPFRSYLQPIVVMIAIPFGVVGAILGHILMGYNLSLISLMGIVALSGIVVNDSLVLIDYANRRVADGLSATDAICEAAMRRFRPVLLTTLTTFGGLAPMIFETSRQARFMIPMALSLGFGIVFATAIILILVPALYILIDDIQRVPDLVRRWSRGR